MEPRSLRPVRAAAGGLAVLILVGAMLLPFYGTGRASVTAVPVLEIRLDPDACHAGVTDAACATVVFNGAMDVDKLPVERCVVVLNETTDTGWASNLSKDTFIFTSTTPQSFNVTVTVPAGTPPERTGHIHLAGQATGNDMWLSATADGTIFVDPFYNLSISPHVRHVDIDHYSQAAFTYRAMNTGTAGDRYRKEVSLSESTQEGWAIREDWNYSGTLRPGESVSGLVKASPRNVQYLMEMDIYIEVKLISENARDHDQVVMQAVIFTIHVNSSFFPTISPYLLILALSVAAALLAAPPSRKGAHPPRRQAFEAGRAGQKN